VPIAPANAIKRSNFMPLLKQKKTSQRSPLFRFSFLWWTNVAKGLTLENVEAAMDITGKIVALLECA
jgi:hypothetical protein